MPIYISDPLLIDQIQASRSIDADRFDECWDGVIVVTPFPNTEHQRLASHWVVVLSDALRYHHGVEVLMNVNVSDRADGWTWNYRGPDVAVVYAGGRACDVGTHLVGGPDFVIEIASPFDRTREKIPFYGQIGVRELLIVDRDPWGLEQLRLAGDRLESAGRSTVGSGEAIDSQVLGLRFALQPGTPRPRIEVVALADGRAWTI